MHSPPMRTIIQRHLPCLPALLQALPVVLIAGALILSSGCTDEAELADTAEETAPSADAASPMADTAAANAATLIEVLEQHDELNTLVLALDTTGLAQTLRTQGPFTLFAPTDAAFDALPASRMDALLKPSNHQQLTDMLTRHLVDGRLPASELRDGEMLTSLSGDLLPITTSGRRVHIGDATVIQNDLRATNGIIHVIDGVLAPPDDNE